MIQVVCMYCQKDLGTKDGKGVSGISHGICPECYDKKPWEDNDEK